MVNLRSRIRGGESATVEFKISVPESEKLARVVAAFANSAGGTIFVGINDNGDVLGVSDLHGEMHAIERGLELVAPKPEIRIEKLVHDLRDVIAVSVPEIDYPELCYLEVNPNRLLYFRVGAETRPVDRPSERAMVRLRRHSRGDRTVDEDAQKLLAWLWSEGPQFESTCARLLNYSSNRVRKLIELLIGAGFVIAYDIGRQRTYAAIHPGPGNGRRR
jgi:predicted HTH transcriptional regulator